MADEQDSKILYPEPSPDVEADMRQMHGVNEYWETYEHFTNTHRGADLIVKSLGYKSPLAAVYWFKPVYAHMQHTAALQRVVETLDATAAAGQAAERDARACLRAALKECEHYLTLMLNRPFGAEPEPSCLTDVIMQARAALEGEGSEQRAG